MNDQLQAQLSDILAQITTSVSQVADFSVAQLPEIAQQYITYGVWSNIFTVVIQIVILIGLGILITKCIKKGQQVNKESRSYYNTGGDGYFIGAVFLGIFAFGDIMFFIDTARNLILALTAPKVWFILEIKDLIS
jgi:hypothetical protein